MSEDRSWRAAADGLETLWASDLLPQTESHPDDRVFCPARGRRRVPVDVAPVEPVQIYKREHGTLVLCTLPEFSEWLSGIADQCAARSDSDADVINLAAVALRSVVKGIPQ